MQEDIENELAKVSRASRGPGVSQHILVPIPLNILCNDMNMSFTSFPSFLGSSLLLHEFLSSE